MPQGHFVVIQCASAFSENLNFQLSYGYDSLPTELFTETPCPRFLVSDILHYLRKKKNLALWSMGNKGALFR